MKTWTTPTHCQPAAPTAGELAVCNVSTNSMDYLETPSSGLRRGVVILLHALGEGGKQTPANVNGLGLEADLLTLVSGLTADGWIVAQPQQNGDNQVGTQSDAVITAVEADTGILFTANFMRWWDHVVDWVNQTYGDVPIVPWGFSMGSWIALQVAVNRPSTIKACAAHHIPTIWSDVTPANAPWALDGTDTSGVDLGAHWLDNVGSSLPIMVSAGANDTSVGYTNPGTGSGMGGATLPTSNFLGIYNNAVTAGVNIQLQFDSSNHELRADDITPATAPVTTTAAGGGATLESLTSLSVGSVTGLTNDTTTIVTSDGQLHAMTFTGTSGGNTLTGCSYSGSQTATVSNGAVVATTPTWLYWFANTVDKLCPQSF